jgi:hypothetical protein
MTTGAQRADAQPGHGIIDTDSTDWEGPEPQRESAETPDWIGEEVTDEQPESGPGRRALAAVLILLGLVWTGISVWSFVQSAPVSALPEILQWVAVTSAPLILLGLLWLAFGRTSRRETERFTHAVAAMRGESQALENVLAIVAARLEENHARLSDEAMKLMTLGDEASDRLGRVTHYLAKESGTLGSRAEALETAANAARVDIGVLLQDLPRAEEQARSLSDSIRTTGMTALEQAGGLEGQLSALVARGREADEIAAGSAQRLAAQLARIESNTSSAAARIDEAATSMTAAIDGSMAHAAEAVDSVRTGIDEQGRAMLAMLDQHGAAFQQAGEDAARGLAQRLDQVSARMQELAGHLAAQDAASHTLVTNLSKELTDLDERFARLTEAGSSGTELMTGSFETVRVCVQQLFEELSGSHDRAGALIERSETMARALSAIGERLDGELPAALARVEEQAGRTHETAAALVPTVEAIQATAGGAASRLGEAEASVARQREALEALLGIVNDGVASAESRLQSLARAVGEADEATAKIVNETTGELVEALVRVRETASQAAEKAREAIGAVIPESAAALGEASRKAVGEAVGCEVNRQMGELGEVAERAVATARQASERLTRQMVVLGESAAAVEARIDEARREQQEKEGEALSRRVSLLIESLNSTAIDVTKILSNEVTDSAWAAYLKGDRGVFTRRAVRLLDATEVREIVQHYEAEPEFRDQVNRYIHDFEAMLRRLLIDPDGSALSVTILSSDMGKLYVALAQAIERFRN